MTSSAQGLVATGTRLYFTGHGSVAFKEVANVKTTPEIGATPQQIEITNLDDVNQRYAMGMGNVPMLAFTVVYKGPDWNTIYALAGNGEEYDWKLVYPDGMYITFTGPFQIQLEPMDVNTAATYTLTIAPDNIPKFHKSDSDSESEESEGGDSGMSYRPMFVKTFDSVADMNSYDDAADDVIQGDFVLINSTDGDRGKVYFYNGDGFTFFANIIGPQGIKGDKGDPGLDMRMLGKEDALPALANEGSFCFVGTTLYSYTNSKWINLGDFKGDKGDKGDQGIQGEKGETGATGPTGPTGPKGETGDSAYTEAVAGGFKGTQEQWIASLKGDKGDSAYTQAVASGFKGSETDWLASLKGDKGDKGDPGPIGPVGPVGAGLVVKGTVKDASQLPKTGNQEGYCYFVGTDLYVWDAGAWKNCGSISPDLKNYTTVTDLNNGLSTKVNVTDMRKPANDVAGIEEVNAKADDSKVAHLSGANNFDTAPTVNNNPLFIANCYTVDLTDAKYDRNKWYYVDGGTNSSGSLDGGSSVSGVTGGLSYFNLEAPLFSGIDVPYGAHTSGNSKDASARQTVLYSQGKWGAYNRNLTVIDDQTNLTTDGKRLLTFAVPSDTNLNYAFYARGGLKVNIISDVPGLTWTPHTDTFVENGTTISVLNDAPDPKALGLDDDHTFWSLPMSQFNQQLESYVTAVTQLNSTDMNTVLTAGFYQLNSGTNGMPNADAWTIYQVIPLSSTNGVQLAYGTNNTILGMRSWHDGNIFTSWVRFADDSKVAHLSGANNFDTVPTVNNNPLLLASSLPSDLARTGQANTFSLPQTFSQGIKTLQTGSYSDVNSLVNEGLYFNTNLNIKNGAGSITAGFIQVISGYWERIRQFMYSDLANNLAYTRVSSDNGSTWSNWVQIITSDQIPTDLARTGQDTNFTGKLQKSGIDVATTTDVTNAVSTAVSNSSKYIESSKNNEASAISDSQASSSGNIYYWTQD